MKRAHKATLALAALALAFAAFGTSACSRTVSHHLLDTVMECAAYRPDMSPFRHYPLDEVAEPPPRYQILAGDLHCHVAPPDRPPHVTRGLAETVALAKSEGLDFVVLTPHVRANFFMSDALRERTLTSLTKLKADVAKQSLGDITFIVGFEYTDFSYGHVGAAFADLADVLAAVPADEAVERPERFFEEYVARGGFLTINHPLLVPLDSAISIARWDLSWKPFTEPGGSYPEEILAAGRLAQGMEVFNLAISDLRDRFLLFDLHSTMRATFARFDEEILARGRRITAVGGSDSHSGHLRAATFVLSRDRSPEAIREALLAGRTCVRDPAACTLEVRGPGGPWLTVGSSLSGVSAIQARARGETVRIVVNGKVIDVPAPEKGIEVPLDPGRCSVIRAVIDEGYSAPVYANCPF